MKPVCIKCHLVMSPKKTGADIELMMDREHPYQIWSADTFECKSCGAEVATHFGAKPVAEHFQQPRYSTFRTGVYAQCWDHIRDIPEAVAV